MGIVENATPALRAGRTQSIAFNWQNGGGYGDAHEGLGITVDGKGPLSRSQVQAVTETLAVRRLTPRECERLQGLPDDYTAIPGAADGPRYKAIGNGMAIPCVSWLARRLEAVR